MRWRDEGGVERIVVAHGLIGTVVMASDDPLAQKVEKELEIPFGDLSWALVKSENSVVAAVYQEMQFEKL